jgi:hypothetical protein
MKYAYAFTAFYRLVQSGLRMYASHELVYPAWYPFDTVSSPGYELVFIMQVIPNFNSFPWKVYLKLKLIRGAPNETQNPVTS